MTSFKSRVPRVSTWSAVRVSRKRSPGPRPSSTRPRGLRPTRRRRPHSSPRRRATCSELAPQPGEADRRRLDHRHRQVPGRLQRGEDGAGADAARRPAACPDRSRGAVPRVRRTAGRVDDPGRRRPRARDANQLVAARVVAEALADAAKEPEIENGRITEIAGPREERLAEVAAELFARRGDSFEIREGRGGPLADPDDPDAAAYGGRRATPTPARSSPAPPSRSGSRPLSRGSSHPVLASFQMLPEQPADELLDCIQSAGTSWAITPATAPTRSTTRTPGCSSPPQREPRTRCGWPCVAPIFMRDPTYVAQLAATLDELSGGRAEVVFGIGNIAMLEQYGVQWRGTRPIARLREAHHVMRTLLDQGRSTTPETSTATPRWHTRAARTGAPTTEDRRHGRSKSMEPRR